MKIKYLGHSCFQIISQKGVSLITDPYTKVGYELPSGLKADVVTTSHAHFDHNFTQAVQSKTVVSQVGAYSVWDIQIQGIPSWHDEKMGALRGENVIFKFVVDGITVCHLGDLGEDITEALTQKIGGVDVLLLPVGGTYTINAEQAKALLEGVAPKVVIPMHFKADGKLDISDVSMFLQQFSPSMIQKEKNGEVEISKENLPSSLRIVYLERQRYE